MLRRFIAIILIMLTEATIAYKQAIATNSDYALALGLVKKFSEGKIWVIGGTVYRSIAQIWYGNVTKRADIDFLVERPLLIPKLVNWSVGANRFGHPRIKNGKLLIDIIPIAEIESMKQSDLSPNIENYLTDVPLTIQSIAYDIDQDQVIGDIGIKALLTRSVGVLNKNRSRLYAVELGITLNDLILEKALSLGFTPHLVDM